MASPYQGYMGPQRPQEDWRQWQGGPAQIGGMPQPRWGTQPGGGQMGGGYGSGYGQPTPSGGGRSYGEFGRFGERTPGVNYTWEDLSFPSDPQWLGGYLRDYANKLGYFGDPRDSALSDFARQQASQTSGALQRRSQMAGQVAGLPTGQRGYAYLQSQLGGQGSEAAIINQLLRQQFEEQQGWARNLAAGFANIPDTRAQTRAMNQAWMGPAGQIAGAALGSFFGPPGMAIGSQIGGQIGGGAGGGGPTNYLGQPGYVPPYYGNR